MKGTSRGTLSDRLGSWAFGRGFLVLPGVLELSFSVFSRFRAFLAAILLRTFAQQLSIE